MPVGGSRHYAGPAVLSWRCPACGADNSGPLEQGCGACGSGAPGRRADGPPPPPAAAPIEPPSPAQRWLAQHPDATLEDAFTAGYVEGIREARRALARRPEAMSAEGKLQRTMIAALAHFRDQVLADNPEEVQTGEWLTAAEATAFIHQLQAQLIGTAEPAHV